jgi:drug/metabolite transporter (DMT)-like permease
MSTDSNFIFFMAQQQGSYLYLLFVGLTCVCFGTGAAMQKHGMASSFPKLTIKTVISQFGQVLKTVLTNWIWVVGVLINLLGGLFYLLSVGNGDITIVQPLINLNIVVAMLIGVLVLREEISTNEWIGVMVMVGGAVALGFTAPEIAAKRIDESAYLVFNIVAIAAILFFALVGKGAGKKINPAYFLSATAGLAFGLSMAIVNALLIKMPSVEHAEAVTIALFLVTGYEFWAIVVLNIVGFLFFQMAFSHGRVSIISPITTIAAGILPVVGGFLVFYEQATPGRIIGILVVLAGTALLVIKPEAAEATKEETIKTPE